MSFQLFPIPCSPCNIRCLVHSLPVVGSRIKASRCPIHLDVVKKRREKSSDGLSVSPTTRLPQMERTIDFVIHSVTLCTFVFPLFLPTVVCRLHPSSTGRQCIRLRRTLEMRTVHAFSSLSKNWEITAPECKLHSSLLVLIPVMVVSSAAKVKIRKNLT